MLWLYEGWKRELGARFRRSCVNVRLRDRPRSSGRAFCTNPGQPQTTQLRDDMRPRWDSIARLELPFRLTATLERRASFSASFGLGEEAEAPENDCLSPSQASHPSQASVSLEFSWCCACDAPVTLPAFCDGCDERDDSFRGTFSEDNEPPPRSRLTHEFNQHSYLSKIRRETPKCIGKRTPGRRPSFLLAYSFVNHSGKDF